MAVRQGFSEWQSNDAFAGSTAHPQLDHVCAELDRMASRIRRLARTGKQQTIDHAKRAAVVRTILRIRKLRTKFLDVDLFADPAWDLLLDLKLAELDQARVSVSAACIAAGVPPTTALRWITTMVDRGLLDRNPDRLDGRRFYLSLARATSAALDNYIDDAARELETLDSLS